MSAVFWQGAVGGGVAFMFIVIAWLGFQRMWSELGLRTALVISAAFVVAILVGGFTAVLFSP